MAVHICGGAYARALLRMTVLAVATPRRTVRIGTHRQSAQRRAGEPLDLAFAARGGERVDYALADFGYAYRHSQAPADIIWIEATYRGAHDDPAAVQARIDEITARRETTQPIREKTGGSTFKNPPGHSSWKLVDDAGWRGRLHAETGGGAKFSELHSNFMINPGDATAADIEGLGEAVRADVLAKTGVQLDWEIRRLGRSG